MNPPPEMSSLPPVKPPARRIVGDTVRAKCQGWDDFFSGTVTKVKDDGTYDITFEDGSGNTDTITTTGTIQIAGGTGITVGLNPAAIPPTFTVVNDGVVSLNNVGGTYATGPQYVIPSAAN